MFPTQRPPAVLDNIDWRTYSRLLRVFAERRGARLTYDRGTLEIRTGRTWEQEGLACLAGHFVQVWTQEMNLPLPGGGCVTLRLRRKHRGLEPDNCYWVANAPRLQGKRRLDLRVDPPPDLAVEGDVTSNPLDHMSIYAALSVPEVWRLSGGGIVFHVLENGAYQIRSNSLAFPQLASADLAPFLSRWGQTDDTSLVSQFRDWVRQQLLTRPPSGTP